MRKLLVANRGEIACRVLRTAHEMGIATVAVYSEPDAGSPHVLDADEAVALPGATAADTYLAVDRLVEAAERTGADAVHPGYGFLAESAAFARACEDAGLVFVGPPPDVIAAMGDKLAAKERMRDAGVPVLDSYPADQVPSDAYPVIVKAALGGGGKGMRVVERGEDLADAVAAARREAAGAFGDDTVFVERYLDRPRHVEVQVLGDAHGTVVHIGERECSIQRRHQKVVEEAPSPAVDADLRTAIGQAAVVAAQAIGYRNAGTVEFILDGDGRYWFLEVNTRLQVEHPVTELAWELADGSALDLVRLQLLVATGEPLGFTQDEVVLRRHAVEARLYAEDPGAGFLPATGRLAVWAPDEAVRWDSGVHTGGEVSPFYDPLLAKAIAAGPTRAEAALRLARALERSRVHGVTTNRDFLVRTLRHPAFLAGELHTGFIDEHDLATEPEPDAPLVRVHAAAAALAAAFGRRRGHTIPSGWRNNRSQPQRVVFGEVDVGYQLERDGSWSVWVDGDRCAVAVHACGTGSIDLAVDGHRLTVAVTTDGDRIHTHSTLGSLTLVQTPRFPAAVAADVAGGLHAPMPGSVVSVAVAEGQEVAQGDLLLVLEAMKMEHRITAPVDGTVTQLRVAAGDQVAADDLLAVLD
jgi:propionyl-CoA carboxylase alpha chain